MELFALTLDFEGAPLTTLTVNGRPAWIAREIGVRLGYAHRGDRFVSKLSGDWSSEFVEGLDIARVTGSELVALKAALGAVAVPTATSKLVVLFETGVYLAVTKTDKPVGIRLRRFIVDEVLPRLARGEPVGAPSPTAAPAVPAPRLRPILELAELREIRMWRRVDLDDRRFRAASLTRIAKLLLDLGRIDQAQWLRIEMAASTIALCVRQPGEVPRTNLEMIAELAQAAA